jgi:NADH-quinone oxidoreductase subunit M
VGIVYGALTAMAQTDLKRLVAYSSVAHMGFVLLALGVGTPAAIGAAMLVMISHGVVSAMLFLLVGLLYERAHTRTIDRFGGLMRTIPAWGVAFTFAALASLGLPGLSGFPGELLTLLEAFDPYRGWLIVALVGLVVSAAYHLWAVRRVNHGPEPGTWSGMKDLDWRERLAVAPLAFAIVLLGVWPGLVLGATDSFAWLLGEIVRSVP